MKSSIILSSLLALTVVLSGCDAIDAMKATKDMKSATNAMNEKMDATNKGISETNDSVRMQKMVLALNDMLDSKNTQDLEPVALGMVAGAEEFGKAATNEQTIKYVYKLLLEIKDVRPNEDLKDANGKYPADIVAAYDHTKMIKLSQIFTIAGFYPQDKVEQLIEDQIYGGGRYQRTTYIFLMARVQFLGTYLQETLFAEPMDTVKAMEDLITRLGAIDSILKAPFKEKVKMNIDTFIERAPITAALYDEEGKMEDSWNAPKLWKKVMKRFDQDLKDGNIVMGSRANSSAVKNQISDLKATVQNYIDSWK